MSSQAPGQHHRKGMTSKQVHRKFATEAKAEAWFVAQRWTDGVRCPRCESDNIQTPTKHKTMPYRCRPCQRYFSVRTGTPMADSNLPLSDWGLAIYYYSTNIKGMSSMKLHRELGITQKAAWHMAHRIREMFDWDFTFDGPVEVDETYLGGKDRNRHEWQVKEGRGPKGKTPVVGMKDRETGKVTAEVVETTDKHTLQGFVEVNTEVDATVYTDGARAYEGMHRIHESVDHSVKEFVRGQAHTNGIESFWANLKRGYVGIYHHFSPKHTRRYVNEFAGRHNLRPLGTEAQMGAMVAAGAGKRLRYADLIGPKETRYDTQMGLW